MYLPIIRWSFTDRPCTPILRSTTRRPVTTQLVLRSPLGLVWRSGLTTAAAGVGAPDGDTATSTSISTTITLSTTTTRTLTGTETGPALYLLAAATTGNTMRNIVVERH